MTTRDGYCLEHRLVMARVVGRPLLPTEVVHHKGGNPRNNAPENLELCANTTDHARKHRPDGILVREHLYDAIVVLSAKHGYPPTVRELQNHFALASPSPIQASLSVLAEEGKVTWDPVIARTIRVIA